MATTFVRLHGGWLERARKVYDPRKQECDNLLEAESVLDMKCDEGGLLAEVAGTMGQSAAAIVGFNSNRAQVETARSLLQYRNLKQYARLFEADLLNINPDMMNAVLTSKSLPTTFDVIFAIDTLPSTSAARVATLRLLASRLTSTSG